MPDRTALPDPPNRERLTNLAAFILGLSARTSHFDPDELRHLRSVAQLLTDFAHDAHLHLIGATPGPGAANPEPLAPLLLLVDDGTGQCSWVNGYLAIDNASASGRTWRLTDPYNEGSVNIPQGSVLRWYALPEPRVPGGSHG